MKYCWTVFNEYVDFTHCKALFTAATGAFTAISQFSVTVYPISSKVRKFCKFLPNLHKGRGTRFNAYYDYPHFTLIPQFYLGSIQRNVSISLPWIPTQ